MASLSCHFDTAPALLLCFGTCNLRKSQMARRERTLIASISAAIERSSAQATSCFECWNQASLHRFSSTMTLLHLLYQAASCLPSFYVGFTSWVYFVCRWKKVLCHCCKVGNVLQKLIGLEDLAISSQEAVARLEETWQHPLNLPSAATSDVI